VAAGLTGALDRAVYELFRPDGVWGPAQVALARVLGLVSPGTGVALLGTVAAVVAVSRRRWTPVAVAGLVTVPTAAVVVATKWVVERADPAGGLVLHHGAFPSGHAALLLTSAAGVALVIRRPVPPWSRMLVAGVWAGTVLCLLVVGTHWFSDVVGGTLVGVAVVAGTILLLDTTFSDDAVAEPWRVDTQPLQNPGP
jgi:membrane-associated phospholipid phosphatase